MAYPSYQFNQSSVLNIKISKYVKIKNVKKRKENVMLHQFFLIYRLKLK